MSNVKLPCASAVMLAVAGVASAHETGGAHAHGGNGVLFLLVLSAVVALIWRMSVRSKGEKARAED